MAGKLNEVKEILVAARQYLGEEGHIKAVRTIEYIGRFEAVSNADGFSGNIK